MSYSPYTNFTKIVANLVGFEHEFVKIGDAEKEEYKKNVNPRGVMPYLQTSEGDVGESNAIARFMCNSCPDSGLYGSSAKEQADIDRTIDRHVSLTSSIGFSIFGPIFGLMQMPDEQFKDAMKKFKDALRTLNDELEGKEFLHGDSLTLADVYIAVALNVPFATFVDAGFRKAVPHLDAWYAKVRNNDAIVSVLGKPRFIGKPLKPHKF